MRYFLLVLFFLLASCLDYDESIEFNQNGNGVFRFTYSFDSAFIHDLSGSTNEPLLRLKDTVANIRSVEGLSLTEVFTNEADGVFNLRATIAFESIGRLGWLDIFENRDFDYSMRWGEGEYRTVIVNTNSNQSAMLTNAEVFERFKILFAGNTLTFRVQLPFPVREYSPKSGKAEGNTVVWKIPVSEYMATNRLELSAKGFSVIGLALEAAPFAFIGIAALSILLLFQLVIIPSWRRGRKK